MRGTKAELAARGTARPVSVREKRQLRFVSQIRGAALEAVWDGKEAENEVEQGEGNGREGCQEKKVYLLSAWGRAPAGRTSRRSRQRQPVALCLPAWEAGAGPAGHRAQILLFQQAEGMLGKESCGPGRCFVAAQGSRDWLKDSSLLSSLPILPPVEVNQISKQIVRSQRVCVFKEPWSG